MINLPSPGSFHAAAGGSCTQRTGNPRRPAAPLPCNGTLEPLQRTRPPAPALTTGSSVGSSHADLPAELVCRIAAHLDAPDARQYALADRGTNKALDELKALRQSQWNHQMVHQLQLMTQGRRARTPQALMTVVQQIPTLDGRLHAEPLEVAGHQLGKVAGTQPGEAAAAVFRAIWQATVALPPRLLAKPLVAIARQVAALPPQERLAALTDALTQMRQLPLDAQRFRTTHEWAHLLAKLPARHAAMGWRHLLAEARQFSPTQRREFVRLLQRVESRASLSWQERQETRAAMDDLLAASPGDGVFRQRPVT